LEDSIDRFSLIRICLGALRKRMHLANLDMADSLEKRCMDIEHALFNDSCQSEQ